MKNKILSAFLVILTLMTMLYQGVFSKDISFVDVPDDYTYAASVRVLAKQGVLRGYGDGTFLPNGRITRAEMAVIICRVKEAEDIAKKTTKTSGYEDVPKNHWASGYISYASQELGILNGYPDGTFAPEQTVTWDETVKIIIHLLGIERGISPKEGEHWSEAYYRLGCDVGFLLDIKIRKHAPIRRGEVAELLYRCFFWEPIPEKIVNYPGSRVPDYTSVTGRRENVPGLSYGYGGAVVSRYFYYSNKREVQMYCDYLESIGWEKSGPVTEPGDTRGECILTGFAHYDSTGYNDSYVQVYQFKLSNAVDIVTTERFD